MEEYKYLPPKFSFAVKDLAEYFCIYKEDKGEDIPDDESTISSQVPGISRKQLNKMGRESSRIRERFTPTRMMKGTSRSVSPARDILTSTTKIPPRSGVSHSTVKTASSRASSNTNNENQQQHPDSKMMFSPYQLKSIRSRKEKRARPYLDSLEKVRRIDMT